MMSGYRINNLLEYSDELSDSNKILGVIVPTDGRTNELQSKLLKGLENLTELKDICTLLINFQYYDENKIVDILSYIHKLGFKVRYIKSEYDCSKGIPINQIMYETANLLNDCKVWLRMDDDIIPRGISPKIGKSCGRQYLECLHYMLSHPKCGVIVCTGTIGKLPPRNYIGPSPKFIGSKIGHHVYLWTGLGMFLRNFDGHVVPEDSLWCLGSAEDILAGAYRIANGYYSAKYNHVRAIHRIKTNLAKGDSNSEDGYKWTDMIKDNIEKYIRDQGWNKDLSMKKFDSQYSSVVTKDYYLNKEGLDITNEKVVEDLTSYYPVVNDRDLKQEILLMCK